MDVDEQLDDELEAAFEEAFEEAPATADDGAGAGDAGDAGEAAGAGPGLDEDDYDDTDAPARGEPATKPDDDSTLQVFRLLKDGGQGAVGGRGQPAAAAGPSQAEEAAAAAAPTSAAPDRAAAYKKEVFDSLTEQQKSRFEAFMRSSIPKPKMKKLMTAILRNAVPNERAIIAMCGISKLFLGELVEMARVCASQEGHTGPLLPRHVHRAYQQLGGLGKLPHTRRGGPPSGRRMFR
ncbi:hypothetical protein CHLRE_01g011350v5 [Chlamydomonas reinhardtii]|uniref:Transcription initiation factor TFIID subunit 11 n=1 Tax=Chlamydomonas reinhardtii TaxID=3055 RepID=A0A2K3E5G4_CHLRE|nr:uncharacterized protein CHLRE_01g011350v5 [Chlamydomonas reinhardtii]PNW88028.1 hypothetical protein CHLRE_01g011350v5 [Chlamydomonas reinhardtii]